MTRPLKWALVIVLSFTPDRWNLSECTILCPDTSLWLSQWMNVRLGWESWTLFWPWLDFQWVLGISGVFRTCATRMEEVCTDLHWREKEMKPKFVSYSDICLEICQSLCRAKEAKLKCYVVCLKAVIEASEFLHIFYTIAFLKMHPHWPVIRF